MSELAGLPITEYNESDAKVILLDSSSYFDNQWLPNVFNFDDILNKCDSVFDKNLYKSYKLSDHKNINRIIQILHLI